MKMWKEMFGWLFGKEKRKMPKNGKWKEFNKHAVLISEGNYLEDLKDGVWRQYYETGELLIEETYRQGMLHGRFTSYHLNGWPLSEGQYRHGLREGYFHIYDDAGNEVNRLLFVNNVEVEAPDPSKTPVRSRSATVISQ